MEIAQQACQSNKLFMMNLSAPFLSQFFKEPMMKAFPYIDIIFGNETVCNVDMRNLNHYCYRLRFSGSSNVCERTEFESSGWKHS
jgi:hypothetical protein